MVVLSGAPKGMGARATVRGKGGETDRGSLEAVLDAACRAVMSGKRVVVANGHGGTLSFMRSKWR